MREFTTTDFTVTRDFTTDFTAHLYNRLYCTPTDVIRHFTTDVTHQRLYYRLYCTPGRYLTVSGEYMACPSNSQ